MKRFHKLWRKDFNEACLLRDKYQCVFCDKKENLQVHHIKDRHEMPNSGYVLANGITVCEEHHLLCEEYHMYDGVCIPMYHPDALYKIIGSSYLEAFMESEKLYPNYDKE
jgi:hypothetical protein